MDITEHTPTAGYILVLNCGSSSVKFALFDLAVTPLPRQPAWKGKVDGVSGSTPAFEASDTASQRIRLDRGRPYVAALKSIRDYVAERLSGRPLRAVAHRVVHGGRKYFEPVRVDADVLADLKSYIPLAPLHQPFALEAIEIFLHSEPDVAQIACFDTAFHQSMPDVEKMLPLSFSAWERGMRRYGFHGLSYEYIALTLAARCGEAARGRTIVAHLGNGASLCAMRDLRSVATTMGFSALDGLMMGTRCGSLDPGAVLYLMEIEKLTVEQVGELLYRRSGLLGISGKSSDMRELLPLEFDNERVRAALALYVRGIVRETGSLVAILGGLDMLVFTAGVGEHHAAIRARVCEALAFLGIALDAAANMSNAAVISSASSPITVMVEPTNEEWMAAHHARDLILGPAASSGAV